MKTPRPIPSGFTLAEVVIAVGVTVIFLAGVFSLLSIGLNTAEEASEDTTVSLILRDVATRVRGNEFQISSDPIGPFYYDNQGRFLEQTAENARQNSYLASAHIGTIKSAPQDSNMLAVTIELYSQIPPIANAPVPPNRAPATIFSYYVTRSTGNGWDDLDSSYVPKIEM